MNKININYLIFFINFCILSLIMGQTNQEKFLKGNLYYDQCLYQNALESYNLINNKSFSIWFNVGNCYYKLGQYIQALVAYKRALKNVSNFEDLSNVNKNIDLIYKKLNIKKNLNHFEKIYKCIWQYILFIPFIVLQILFLICWSILLLFITKFVREKSYFKFFFFIFINCLFIVFLLIRHIEENKKIGIIVQDNTIIYSGPETNYHIIGNLSLADEVKVNRQIDKWVQVSNSKVKGWLQIDKMSIL